MHELSIAITLVELAADAARSLGAARVNKLFVRLGTGAGVTAEALRFSFDLAAEGTIVQGARLELERVDGPNLQLSAMEIVDAAVPANC
jgi:hydrogenase nickel incorporation protein HypA/HybF